MLTIERSTRKRLANKSLTTPFELRSSLCELFHENTKLGPLTSRAYAARIAAFVRSRRVREMLTRSYKVYSLMDQIELEKPALEGELAETIAARRSVRRLSGVPMSLRQLGRLLFLTYGRTAEQGCFRAVASGGALYPLELYVAALNVTGLETGIYHYGVEHHRLDVVERGDPLEAIRRHVACEGIEVERAAIVVIVTAMFRRTTLKYQDRGYRMILLEAGAACQNLSLVATQMGLGVCQVGGFHDDALSTVLGIDGMHEAPLVPIVIGGRPDNPGGEA